MQPGLRTLLVLGLLWMGGSASHAQGQLPTEQQLNPLGLTLMWWGQATIDRNRDQVEFISADEQNLYIQSRTGIITTFGVENGRRLWDALLGSPDRVGYPASSNDEQLLITSGLTIYSLDKMTGRVLWQLLVPTLPSASPEVDANAAYIGSVDGSVYAFDLARVRELHQEGRLPQWAHLARMWRYKAPSEIIAPPVSTGATVAFVSKQGMVIGVAAKSKKLKFQFETDARIYTPLGRSGNLIFVANQHSRLYCLNQENGTMLWSFSTGAPVVQMPQIIGGHVFAVPHREGLECISVESGYRIWKNERITRFVAASDTKVYASDLSENLLVLDRSNGKIISALPMRGFPRRISNDRTDRVILATNDGLVLCLREIGSDFPTYHLYPERRPILPELAPEEDAKAAEMPEQN